MSEHKVFCAKLKQELPGLPEPPFDSDLGKKIYDNVSQQAWGQWMEHCKMLLNEYRLNPARKQDQEVIVQQMEQFSSVTLSGRRRARDDASIASYLDAYFIIGIGGQGWLLRSYPRPEIVANSSSCNTL